MTDRADVIVVGASLVAPALCLSLARAGVRPLLLDTRPPEYSLRDPRPLALAQSSVRILTTLGVWPALAETAEAINGIHVSERGRFGKVRMRARDCGVEAFGYVVNAGDVAQALARQLEAESAVVARHHVDHLDWHGDVAEARLTGSVMTDPARAVRSFSAALLVATELGPDGIGGLTIDIREHDYQQVAIACAPRVGRAHAGVAYERFTREGPLALLPLPEGRAGLVWTLAPEAGARVHALSDDEFCYALTRAAGHWLAPFSNPGQRGMFPLRLRTGVLQDHSARALLLGGAAVQLHPVAGQGLNLALRDVATLADLVAGVSRDGSDLGDKTLRGQFERARRADRGRVRAATDVLAQSFVRDWPGLRLARGLSMTALGLAPGLKSRFASAAMGLAAPQSRLLRGLNP